MTAGGAASIERLIKEGRLYIRSQQRLDGGFNGYASASPSDFTSSRLQPTTFFTSLIAGCMTEVADSKRIVCSAERYLLSHKSSSWSWNYWQRDPTRTAIAGYPDDLDDTACALAVLVRASHSAVDGVVHGQLARQLVAAEIAVGGPYQTWLVAASELERWYDVDVAVNANIAHLLYRLGVMPPGLEYYLTQALRNGDLNSSYYIGHIPSLYFIARSHIPAHRQLLRSLLGLETVKPAGQRTSLMNALLISTAVRCGCAGSEIDAMVAQLYHPESNGNWPAAALYLEPVLEGVQYYAGSAALTTAFVCEALSLYRGNLRPGHAVVAKRSETNLATVTTLADSLQEIYSRLAADLPPTGYDELALCYYRALIRIREQDQDGQISGLAVRLNYDSQAGLSVETLSALQAASILGWLAYTLYDDVFDGDASVSQIGAANVALRQSVAYFRAALPASISFELMVGRCLAIVDAANTWEVDQARATLNAGKLIIPTLPDYGDLQQLADKSWGHALASCGVLLAKGFAADGPEIGCWLGFFRHFLVARQLNDDAHDWRSDLLRGQLSAVVCMLLSDRKFPLELDITTDMAAIQQQFWDSIVIRVCNLIESEVAAAEVALQSCTFIINRNTYLELLDTLRAAAVATRAGRQDALAFQRGFSGASETS